ncbi:CinA family protein [Hydrogenobacter hydrogenophilus]|uniref:Nicotinamide-nucleotide amidase n=1 Tax=Hydrogenobacter hydrogenophilus TaxID=35835 RepID=A0A285NRS2_9AQUI|nr:CinA family protein [Hydrogenobacter hydrogenophilus]SNZ12220.1 nicotinamide-nucleotide amidase [Hydrogenobacter hydrogenophilus]
MIATVCKKRKAKSSYLLRTFGLDENTLKSYNYKKWLGGADLFFQTQEEKMVAYEKLKDFVYADEFLEMEEVVVSMLKRVGLKLAVAESSSGGLLSARIVNVAGSSEVFLGGFIAYANDLKTKLLGIDESLIRKFGAVSKEVCRAMCIGVLEETDADVSLAITGIAGPGGGTQKKPVGLTFIGLGTDSEVIVEEHRLKGSRNENRFLSTQIALDMLRRFLRERYIRE